MRDLLYPVRPIGRIRDLDAVNAPPCGACDTGFHAGCDCPVCRVYLDDAYQYAPEAAKAGRDFRRAKGEAVESGEKRVAAFGRILPHSRRRA